MASDTGFTGRGLYVKFGATELNTNYRAFNPSESIAQIDQTAGSDTHDSFLDGVTSGAAPLTFKYPSDDTATWGAVALGTEATLEWGDEGTATGKPKHSCLAKVINRAKDYSHNGLTVATVQFQFNSDVTDDAY